MRNKDKVLAWIEKNFETDQITIEDYPLFPSGQLIKDKNGGQMVVFYDFMTGRIETVLPSNS